MFETISCITLA